jgi:AbrB family looped-hinge helix DNA binding protein
MYKATVTGKRQITIPLEICEKLNVTNGNQVEFIIEDNKIIFQKLKPNKSDICPYCNEYVYTIGNHVTFEGVKYHMACWYNKNK